MSDSISNILKDMEVEKHSIEDSPANILGYVEKEKPHIVDNPADILRTTEEEKTPIEDNSSNILIELETENHSIEDSPADILRSVEEGKPPIEDNPSNILMDFQKEKLPIEDSPANILEDVQKEKPPIDNNPADILRNMEEEKTPIQENPSNILRDVDKKTSKQVISPELVQLDGNSAFPNGIPFMEATYGRAAVDHPNVDVIRIVLFYKGEESKIKIPPGMRAGRTFVIKSPGPDFKPCHNFKRRKIAPPEYLRSRVTDESTPSCSSTPTCSNISPGPSTSQDIMTPSTSNTTTLGPVPQAAKTTSENSDVFKSPKIPIKVHKKTKPYRINGKPALPSKGIPINKNLSSHIKGTSSQRILQKKGTNIVSSSTKSTKCKQNSKLLIKPSAVSNINTYSRNVVRNVSTTVGVNTVRAGSETKPSVSGCPISNADVVTEPCVSGCPIPNVDVVEEPSVSGCPIKNADVVTEPSVNGCSIPNVDAVTDPSVSGCPTTKIDGMTEPSVSGCPITNAVVTDQSSVHGCPINNASSESQTEREVFVEKMEPSNPNISQELQDTNSCE